MLEARSIDRKIALAPAYDYAFLRAEGLAHIQKLSGMVWTDHNIHDPGITTLELLAYALTDLAYRTGFDTKDLMTGPDGKMDPSAVSGLAPAHEVLTTAPRTIADYRRLLLRIERLRNAWLDPMQNPAEPANYRLSEVPVYADCLADALSYETKNAVNQQNHPVRISGLYKVLVELEIDDLLGSMNEAALIYQVRRGPLKGAVLGFDITDPAFAAVDLTRDLVSIDSVNVTAVQPGFSVKLTVTLTGGQSLTFDPGIVRVIEDRPRPDKPALNITAQTLRGVLLPATLAADDMVPLFWQKQQRRARALNAVSRVLHAHRGLCEDYLSVATVKPFRVGICADIEVKPDADLELVQAQVFHAIEKYLSAPVRYHTLDEMLASGRQPDEIFNGPFIDFDFTVAGQKVFTKPGFITDEDLAASELRRKVQASDIINIVVDIEGVEAISNLQLRAYDSAGLPTGPAAKWTLAVPADHQPVFYMEASKILFHKAGIPYRAQVTEFERTLDYLRGLDRRELYVPPDQIPPVPVGRWRNLDAFYSVQHDFPGTYKIGTAKISDTESPERIARARQLKGYLTFFDQVLADYLGQLANLRRLYSLDRNLKRTWFTPFVTQIAGSLDEFPDEFYIDKAKLADETVRTRLTETEEEFLDRRNRALDHLIARFAERFADYALLSFRLSGDRLKTSAQLIGDKIDFLEDYPKLSRERGQASNLIPEKSADVWNTGNVSGLERRAGRLLGIDDLTRRDLACAGHFAALFGTQKQGNQFRVIVKDAAGQVIFASSELFASEAEATAAAQKTYPDLREEGAFSIAASQGTTTFTMAIVSGGGTLTHNKTFDTERAATEAARAIIDRYDEVLASDLCNSEGMHLIEHILLRPRAKGDALMGVCLGEDCGFCSEEDPYSFRVSVVLPYWPERFRNLNFRALLERTLREEAPAHVQVKICWISQSQMTDFDLTYRQWRNAWAAPKINPTVVRNTSRRLIELLDNLKTVYPAASLHDCDEGENETIVRLGSTALGIF